MVGQHTIEAFVRRDDTVEARVIPGPYGVDGRIWRELLGLPHLIGIGQNLWLLIYRSLYVAKVCGDRGVNNGPYIEKKHPFGEHAGNGDHHLCRRLKFLKITQGLLQAESSL